MSGADDIAEAIQKDERFEEFLAIVEYDIHAHPVITANPYTKWFKQGEANTEQLRDLFLQLSVFSMHFLPIQAKRMANADTEEGEKGARDILANELGVGMDVKTGSTEGKRFSHAEAHINWLRKGCDALKLDPRRLGKWNERSRTTHAFLRNLEETYGSHDGQVGAGASYAIETWAGWGIGKGKKAEENNFWMELITGIELCNTYRDRSNLAAIPVGFFRYHFETESGHAANVREELERTFLSPQFNQEKWFYGASVALGAIYTFWKGLNDERKKLD